MKKLISMAMLAMFASMAAANPDCTHAIPQVAGGGGNKEAPSAAGQRQQALLGCDPGAASLLLPGVGVFSWAAANGPDFFFNVFTDQAEQDRKRLKEILDCYERVATCRQKADAQLARGEVACSNSKIVFNANRTGDRWGGGISLDTAAPSLYGSCNAGNEAAVVNSRYQCGDMAQICRGL